MEAIDALPYGQVVDEKEFASVIADLTRFHMSNNVVYQRICDSIFSKIADASALASLPYIPARLFKRLEMSSVLESQILRTMQSSGTSGTTSKIPLDRETSRRQARYLISIMRYWLGTARLPMIIVDSPRLLRNDSRNSARAAAVLGMMQMGLDYHWVLDEQGHFDRASLQLWLEKQRNRRVFIFGFTSQVWDFFDSKLTLGEVDLSNGILFHGGGWKKLLNESVSRNIFRKVIGEVSGLVEIHDYYGMVEQLGSIWVESSPGVFVPPASSRVIIRDVRTLEPLPEGETGLIQTFSTIPYSYPGQSVLTDDLGYLTENKVHVETLGTLALSIVGRIPRAEPRGCSDAAPHRADMA